MEQATLRLGGQRVAVPLVLVLTLVLLVSWGGQVLFLPLAPLYFGLATRSRSPLVACLWLVPPTIGAGIVLWALTYVAVGELKPWIWLLPLAVSVAAAVLLYREVFVRRHAAQGL